MQLWWGWRESEISMMLKVITPYENIALVTEMLWFLFWLNQTRRRGRGRGGGHRGYDPLWSWESGEVSISWQMSQFGQDFPNLSQIFTPRRVRKNTLVIISLSVSLQCLAKLMKRLFCELLKNTWKTIQSFVIANMDSRGECPVYITQCPSMVRLPT